MRKPRREDNAQSKRSAFTATFDRLTNEVFSRPKGLERLQGAPKSCRQGFTLVPIGL